MISLKQKSRQTAASPPHTHALSEQVQLVPRPTGQSFSHPPDLLVSPRGPKCPVILRLEHVVRIGLQTLAGCDVPERLEFSRQSSSPRPPSVGCVLSARNASPATLFFPMGSGVITGPGRPQARKENKHAAHTSRHPLWAFFCQISPPPVSAVSCFLPLRLPACCPVVFL